MSKRLSAIGIVVTLISSAAALLAAPSHGAGDPQNCGFRCRVDLTTTGPSPSALAMSATGILHFANADSVSHTVEFTNGLCSISVGVGQWFAGCPSRFMRFVGSYGYTVDGKFSGIVMTTPLSRSVSLTARTHMIGSNSRLTLHGRVIRSNSGAAPPPPVVIRARHDSSRPFEPIATVRTKGSHQTAYGWKLTVQPNVATTYIAKVTTQRLCYYPAARCAQPHGQVWANATSQPFAVGSRYSAAHAAHAAGRATTVRVSTHNSRYVFSAKSAPRGVVIFKITNPASEPHDLSIDGRTSRLLRTGERTTLRVTFLRKGRYSYRDTFDHHAQFGCRGGFRIT